MIYTLQNLLNDYELLPIRGYAILPDLGSLQLSYINETKINGKANKKLKDVFITGFKTISNKFPIVTVDGIEKKSIFIIFKQQVSLFPFEKGPLGFDISGAHITLQICKNKIKISDGFDWVYITDSLISVWKHILNNELKYGCCFQNFYYLLLDVIREFGEEQKEIEKNKLKKENGFDIDNFLKFHFEKCFPACGIIKDYKTLKKVIKKMYKQYKEEIWRGV